MSDNTELSAGINNLVEQASQMQIQKELKDTFDSNIALFKEIAPDIYEEYKNYTPTEYQLGLDEEGDINLYHMSNGAAVYPSPAEEFCSEQVDAYQDNPLWMGHSYSIEKENFIQLDYTNPLLEPYINQTNDFEGDMNKPIGLMVIAGVGLGYHVVELIERFNIFHLCIFEPNKDSFYASLHTIDWQPLINKAKQFGQSLNLFINKSVHQCMLSMRYMAATFGQHISCNSFYYNHLDSEEIKTLYNTLRMEYQHTFTAFGFFEDEQISLAHTAENLKSAYPILNKQPPPQKMPPLFIVGNGPSLDEHIETIKKHQDNCILFSCGSTIGTLKKEGIIPDFQIEMERTYQTTLLHKEDLDLDYLGQINVIALNAVAPETLTFFKNAFICTKAFDAGVELVENHSDGNVQIVKNCNPTCTNTGLAIALALGFKEIYLLGVDLGMKDKEAHHAKNSRYFDGSSQFLDLSHVNQHFFHTQGNFDKTVLTTTVLDRTRSAMVQLLNEQPDCKVYNLNHGAFIHGTTPLDKKDIKLELDDFNKSSFISKLCEEHFNKPTKANDLDKDTVLNEYLKDAIEYIEKWEYSKDVTNIAEAKYDFDVIIYNLGHLKNRSMLSYCMLNGSILTFTTYIMAVLYTLNKEELPQYYQTAMQIFKNFLAFCRDFLEQNCLKVDDDTRGLPDSDK